MDQAEQQSTPEDRMMALLDDDGDNPEIMEEKDKPGRTDDLTEPKNDAEEADQEESEQEETPETEEEKEVRLLKLKHDGVEIEKPEDEVIALAQQGFDYTQKTQRLADERKAFENQAQTLKAQEKAFQQQTNVQNALMQEIAKATAIDQQLSQYQNLDWQALSNTDPVEAQKLFFAYNQLQVQRGQVVAWIQQKQQEFFNAQSEAKAKQVELGQQILTKDIPGWGPELAKSLLDTCKTYGYTDAELADMSDPKFIKILNDAAQWKKLQASKPIVDKKVSTASPTVKPGAKNTRNAESARDKVNCEQLRKTGKSDYAAKLIERMI